MTLSKTILVDRNGIELFAHVTGWVTLSHGRYYVKDLDSDLILNAGEQEWATEALIEEARQMVLIDGGMEDYRAWRAS